MGAMQTTINFCYNGHFKHEFVILMARAPFCVMIIIFRYRDHNIKPQNKIQNHHKHEFNLKFSDLIQNREICINLYFSACNF